MSATSSCTGVGSYGSGGASSDYEVKTIEKQIQDWKSCPTTDPQTKRDIVDKLQTKLNSVKAVIEQHSQDRVKMHDAEADTSEATGLGRRLDLRA